MLKDGKNDYNVYIITTNKRVEKKKIMVLILLIIVAIGLIMIAKNSIAVMNQYEVYQQYEAQLVALQKQEYEQIEIEKEQEKAKYEKIPQLTEER